MICWQRIPPSFLRSEPDSDSAGCGPNGCDLCQIRIPGLWPQKGFVDGNPALASGVGGEMLGPPTGGRNSLPSLKGTKERIMPIRFIAKQPEQC